jgi:hypothetical protein
MPRIKLCRTHKNTTASPQTHGHDQRSNADAYFTLPHPFVAHRCSRGRKRFQKKVEALSAHAASNTHLHDIIVLQQTRTRIVKSRLRARIAQTSSMAITHDVA